MKGLDITGFALIALGIVFLLAFGPPKGGAFGYSLWELMPVFIAIFGVVLIVAARLKK